MIPLRGSLLRIRVQLDEIVGIHTPTGYVGEVPTYSPGASHIWAVNEGWSLYVASSEVYPGSPSAGFTVGYVYNLMKSWGYTPTGYVGDVPAYSAAANHIWAINEGWVSI